MKLIAAIAGSLVVACAVACGGMVLDLGGSVNGPVDAACARTGSATGKWLAFDSDRDGTRAIYLMHSDGTGVVRFMTSAFVEKEPAFSPDGSKLAYTTDASGVFQIHVLDLSTGTSRQLTTHASGAHQPAWSPDGNWIAFVGLPPAPYDGGIIHPPQGTADLFVIRPDGTGERDIFAPSVDYPYFGAYPGYAPFTPTFSADSSVVVFGGLVETIHAVGVDGTGLRELVDGVTEGSETPTVSPDGTRIAFASVADPIGSGLAIRVSSFSDDCQDPLHSGCSTVLAKPSSADMSYHRPAWGPTGSIAFETKQPWGTEAKIAVVSVQDNTTVIITSGTSDDRNPTWVPSDFDCSP